MNLTVYGIPAPNKTGDTNAHFTCHDTHQRMSIELSEAHALLIVKNNQMKMFWAVYAPFRAHHVHITLLHINPQGDRAAAILRGDHEMAHLSG